MLLSTVDQFAVFQDKFIIKVNVYMEDSFAVTHVYMCSTLTLHMV